MAEKIHRIHSLPDESPWQGGLPPEGDPEHPLTIRMLDRVLAVQRPVVLAHLRSIRLRHPGASPAQIVTILERRYLAAVTSGGAAVGATAVVPGIGTGITLALSGVETVGFLEATTLFAQSVTEVHGIRVENPDRARALVLTLMLGQEGVDLVLQLAKQFQAPQGAAGARSAYWGELITKTLPRAALTTAVDRLKTTFVHQFSAKAGASFLGKALPFGIGAAIGGTGNHVLGRRVVAASRKAFGPPPAVLPAELEPGAGAAKLESRALSGALSGAKRLGRVAGSAGTAIAGTVSGAVSGAVGGLTAGRNARRNAVEGDGTAASTQRADAES